MEYSIITCYGELNVVFYNSGIISDLFPRVEIPVVDYGIMEQSIRNMLIKKGYDDLYSTYYLNYYYM